MYSNPLPELLTKVIILSNKFLFLILWLTYYRFIKGAGIMNNQQKDHSIFEVFLFVLSCLIIVVGVCGCKKSELPTEQSHKTVFECEETPTREGIPIIVVNEVIWRIVEPEDWRKTLQTFRFATEEDLLRSRIRDTSNNVTGRHYFFEFINPDPNKIQIPQIEREMLTDMQQSVTDAGWGIEIEKVFIKQFRLSEEVQKRYNEMVEQLREQGEGE